MYRRKMAYVNVNYVLLSALLFLFQTTIFGVSGLRNMDIKVPEAVRVGDTVTLSCDYDLEQAALYSSKWYRNDVEFYRFVPKESPPSKVFPVPHIAVSIVDSNSKQVTLTNVERETAGEFKCEVSADAPLFHTEIRAAHLLVADTPDEAPIVKTDMQKIAPGAKLRANCTAPVSYPAVNVTWLINNEEIHPKYGADVHEVIERYDSLPDVVSVRSTLTIRAVPDLFKIGKLKLRCLATLFSLYRRTQEIEITEDAPLMALIMVPTTPANRGLANQQGTSISVIYLCTIYSLLFRWIHQIH